MAQIDPSSADDVARALRDYLAHHVGQDVMFAEPPAEIEGGRSTFVYAFRLATTDGLEEAWQRPLILRVMALAEQTEQAEREAAVQNWAVDNGYPAPRVLAVETAFEKAGAGAGEMNLPFIVMERLPGVSMLEKIGPSIPTAFRLTERMADLQADLHALPTTDFPVPYERPAIDTVLDDFKERISTFNLRHLQRAYRVLDEHRSIAIPEDPVVCHNDIHFLNLIVDDDDNIGVIDWEGAALADRHCGVAWTMMVLNVVLFPAQNPLGAALGFISGFFRPAIASRYLERYQTHAELDPLRLCYWEAVQTFGLWLQISVWKTAARAGPDVEVPGKPDNAGFWPRSSIDNLRNHLRGRLKELDTLLAAR